ncbi:MAG: NAD(P)-dependent oxidoreductase [Planctomycetota bacterium]|nr:NAD(P)-dependent oxidoreductase [Planctomycetota bacterium]
MTPETIVLCFPVSEREVQRIQEAAGPEVRVLVSSQERIHEDIMEADIFCGHAKKPVDWGAVVGQGRLRWIQSSAAGLDHCLTPTVADSSILISGCSGLFADQVAEQTLALTFGLLRGLPTFFRAQVRREFNRRPTDELAGETVGIIGFGGNGQRIAECLRPLAGRILATDHFSCDVHFPGVEVWESEQVASLFEMARIVICTLPLTAGNLRLIGKNCFAAMPAGSYFINVGRGAVVDQTAMLEALTEGPLVGVGLDVVDPEPLPPEDPLWGMENVLITPHVGAQSKWRVLSTVNLFCENLRRFRSGSPLINRVDKQLGFPRPENRLTCGQRNELRRG